MASFSAPDRDRVAWGLLGLGTTAVVAYVVYAAVGAIVLGLFLYYATRPVRDRLAARAGREDVAATLALLSVAVPLLVVLGYAAVVGVHQLDQFLAAHELSRLRAVLGRYVELSAVTDPRSLLALGRDHLGRVVPLLLAGVVWVVRAFVALVVAFFLLRDGGAVAGWFGRSFGPDAVAFFERVDDSLATIYVGNLLTVAITAVIAAATFAAFDLVVPGSPIGFPLLLGLLVGAFTVVPAVGVKAVWVPYAGVLLVRSLAFGRPPLWVPVAFAAVTLVVVDAFPDVVVRSYVSKGDINMGLMLLAYTLGVLVLGWYGLFLGPLVLAVFRHFARDVLPGLVSTDGPVVDG